MGVIQNGILGKFSGKVAGVVGANWKDKAYMRAYVKPANPNTAGQQVQRTLFANAVAFAKPLVGQIFNTYTDKFQKTMSGFNFFIKRNIAKFVTTPDYVNILISEGTLSPVAGADATYTDDTVTIQFTTNYGNNGLATDQVFACVWDNGAKIWYFAAAEVDRSSLSIDVLCKSGLTASNLFCYLVVAQYVDTVLSQIANSISDEAS